MQSVNSPGVLDEIEYEAIKKMVTNKKDRAHLLQKEQNYLLTKFYRWNKKSGKDGVLYTDLWAVCILFIFIYFEST